MVKDQWYQLIYLTVINGRYIMKNLELSYNSFYLIESLKLVPATF